MAWQEVGLDGVLPAEVRVKGREGATKMGGGDREGFGGEGGEGSSTGEPIRSKQAGRL